MIHGVDTEAHGGAAEFGVPATAPRHGVVSDIAIPEGVADPDERPAEFVGPREAVQVGVGRGKTHLEHARGVATGAGLGFLDPVKFGQRSAERFLAEHPGAGFHGGDAHGGVGGRRRGDQHQVGFYLGQRGGIVGEGVRELEARPEGVHPGGVEIDGGDELDATVGVFDGAHVGIGD